jgi:hypothetical protein
MALSFVNFSGYDAPKPGLYPQPINGQAMQAVTFRQRLGNISFNEPSANRDMLIAMELHIRGLQQLVEKILTRLADLESRLDESKLSSSKANRTRGASTIRYHNHRATSAERKSEGVRIT